MSWDEDTIEKLLTLHHEGKTAGEIGAELGKTRNAVIGKLHRMGMARKQLEAAKLAREKEEEERRLAEQAKRDDAATKEGAKPNGQDQEVSELDTIEAHRESAKNAEEKSLRLSLMELTSRTCKWPIGDPATEEFWFCGLPSQPGKPYCTAHNNLACQPLSSRRDRKLVRKPAPRPVRG